jgi:hypothetical protein
MNFINADACMSFGARGGAFGWRVTSRKVADSIPDEHNATGHTMALESTEPLREMIVRRISWGGDKGGRSIGLTTLSPSFADRLEV